MVIISGPRRQTECDEHDELHAGGSKRKQERMSSQAMTIRNSCRRLGSRLAVGSIKRIS